MYFLAWWHPVFFNFRLKLLPHRWDLAWFFPSLVSPFERPLSFWIGMSFDYKSIELGELCSMFFLKYFIERKLLIYLSGQRNPSHTQIIPIEKTERRIESAKWPWLLFRVHWFLKTLNLLVKSELSMKTLLSYTMAVHYFMRKIPKQLDDEIQKRIQTSSKRFRNLFPLLKVFNIWE